MIYNPFQLLNIYNYGFFLLIVSNQFYILMDTMNQYTIYIILCITTNYI